ncbi:MAG: type II toxin-antitoxin system RelE/ParE family toxin [Acidobacteriota bacterium]
MTTPCAAGGRHQTSKYMDALRDTMKGLVKSTVFARTRDDLRPAIQMATSGRQSILFATDESRILVVRVLHASSMDYRRHLDPSAAANEDD